MCRRVDCAQCGRPTYAGCGAHIEQVLSNVPVAERCTCRETKSTASASTTATAGADSQSWLQRLFTK